MLAKVLSCAVVGLDGAVVEVEVDIASGLPAFYIVGLPDTAVQEAKERVRSAVRNSGLQFPQRRITVNLAPADLRKEGPAYDLPIAVGIIIASGQGVAAPSRPPLPPPPGSRRRPPPPRPASLPPRVPSGRAATSPTSRDRSTSSGRWRSR